MFFATGLLWLSRVCLYFESNSVRLAVGLLLCVLSSRVSIAHKTPEVITVLVCFFVFSLLFAFFRNETLL